MGFFQRQTFWHVAVRRRTGVSHQINCCSSLSWGGHSQLPSPLRLHSLVLYFRKEAAAVGLGRPGASPSEPTSEEVVRVADNDEERREKRDVCSLKLLLCFCFFGLPALTSGSVNVMASSTPAGRLLSNAENKRKNPNLNNYRVNGVRRAVVIIRRLSIIRLCNVLI